jgi:hypothetical protein
MKDVWFSSLRLTLFSNMQRDICNQSSFNLLRSIMENEKVRLHILRLTQFSNTQRGT